MTKIEVGFGAIVGDEDLAVLKRAHRAGIDVDVRVEFLQRTRKPRHSRKRPIEAAAIPCLEPKPLRQ